MSPYPDQLQRRIAETSRSWIEANQNREHNIRILIEKNAKQWAVDSKNKKVQLEQRMLANISDTQKQKAKLEKRILINIGAWGVQINALSIATHVLINNILITSNNWVTDLKVKSMDILEVSILAECELNKTLPIDVLLVTPWIIKQIELQKRHLESVSADVRSAFDKFENAWVAGFWGLMLSILLCCFVGTLTVVVDRDFSNFYSFIEDWYQASWLRHKYRAAQKRELRAKVTLDAYNRLSVDDLKRKFGAANSKSPRKTIKTIVDTKISRNVRIYYTIKYVRMIVTRWLRSIFWFITIIACLSFFALIDWVTQPTSR